MKEKQIESNQGSKDVKSLDENPQYRAKISSYFVAIYADDLEQRSTNDATQQRFSIHIKPTSEKERII